MPVIPALKFKASISYVARPCLKKKKKKTSQLLVAHTYNLRDLGGRDKEDQGSKSAPGK
jgi:hypothetical protein